MNPLGRTDIIKKVVETSDMSEEYATKLIDGLFTNLLELLSSDDILRVNVRYLGVFRTIYAKILKKRDTYHKILMDENSKLSDSSKKSIKERYERYSKLIKLLEEDYKKKLHKKDLKRKYYESHNNMEKQKSNP